MQVPDLGAKIQNALGVPPDLASSGMITLVGILLDDSSSIASAHNTDNVIEGFNLIRDAIAASAEADTVQMFVDQMNHGGSNGFQVMSDVMRLDRTNFRPHGATPLYDKALLLYSTILAKTHWYEQSGVACRSISCIITDGAEYGSREGTPAKVKALVDSLLQQEQHVVTAVGIDDGSTDFVSVFTKLGLLRDFILTPKNSPSEIRKAFQMVSKSVGQVSAAAGGNVSKLGGFGS